MGFRGRYTRLEKEEQLREKVHSRAMAEIDNRTRRSYRHIEGAVKPPPSSHTSSGGTISSKKSGSRSTISAKSHSTSEKRRSAPFGRYAGSSRIKKKKGGKYSNKKRKKQRKLGKIGQKSRSSVPRIPALLEKELAKEKKREKMQGVRLPYTSENTPPVSLFIDEKEERVITLSPHKKKASKRMHRQSRPLYVQSEGNESASPSPPFGEENENFMIIPQSEEEGYFTAPLPALPPHPMRIPPTYDPNTPTIESLPPQFSPNMSAFSSFSFLSLLCTLHGRDPHKREKERKEGRKTKSYAPVTRRNVCPPSFISPSSPTSNKSEKKGTLQTKKDFATFVRGRWK